MALPLFVLMTLMSTCFAQVCLRGSGSGPALPTFPDQFSTEIEANILYLNLTLRITEYYDNINNRGRIDVYSTFGTNTTLVNYDTLEVSHIATAPDGSKSCFAAPLAANSSRFARRLFGTEIINGTAHVTTASQFLLFGAEFNETYIGEEMVRGIPCLRWQSCNASQDGRVNYTIDYYFTKAGWSQYPSMIPVQIIVRGIRPDNFTVDATHEVNNVYSFINFRPGPADDDLFRVTPGQVCMGRITGKPLPPLPNDYFTMLYENIQAVDATIRYFREYYYYSQQLYRIDVLVGFPNTTTILEDFNEGVQYTINNQYGDCSVTPISPFSLAVTTDSEGMLHLQTLKEHFVRNGSFGYSYEGVSQVRGVDTESWISLRNNEPLNNNQTTLVNGYIQVFFTQPGWSVVTSFNGRPTSNMSVPWRFIIAGNFSDRLPNGTQITSPYSTSLYNVLEFQTNEPDSDVFDASVCFGIDQHTLLSLNLPLPAGTTYTSIDHNLLRSRVRMALSQAVNIPASRIGGLHVYQTSADSIILFLHVLDAPPFSKHQNTMSRDQIVSQLMDKVNKGQVSVTLGDVTFTPSIRLRTNNGTNNGTCEEKEESDGLSNGVVAGISVACFIVGLMAGMCIVCLIHCILRAKSSGKYTTSPYNKHQDEAVIS